MGYFKKSISAIVLVGALVFSLFACGGTDQALAPTGQSTTEQVGTTGIFDDRMAVSDDLPERDFGGHVFTILTYDPTRYLSEGETGEVVNDALFKRNTLVEDRFNIKIAVASVPGIADMTTSARKSVLAGDNAYDLLIPHIITSAPTFLLEHLIYDWNDIPYVDFSKPWWNKSIIETTKIKGHQYFASSDLNLATFAPFCMIYNKQYVENYSLEDLYTVVREGRWTIDYILDILKGIPKDLDGNDVFDKADQYGLTLNDDNTTLNFMYGFDHHSVLLDENSYPQPNVNNERMQNIVNKVSQLIFEGNRTFLTKYANQDADGFGMFSSGRAFIVASSVGTAQTFKDVTFDFGLIPYPKLDEAQEGYHTHTDAWGGILCVPVTAPDPGRTGIIVEALSAESYRYLAPAYYEIALGNKYLRDEESVEMLDLIYDGRLYDFGYIFDSWKGATWTLPYLIGQKSTDLTSYYSKRESAILKNYELIFSAISE
ncbi:MAG: hypothetical protein AB9835_13535 [Eubacteriales bacterium]